MIGEPPLDVGAAKETDAAPLVLVVATTASGCDGTGSWLASSVAVRFGKGTGVNAADAWDFEKFPELSGET